MKKNAKLKHVHVKETREHNTHPLINEFKKIDSVLDEVINDVYHYDYEEVKDNINKLNRIVSAALVNVNSYIDKEAGVNDVKLIDENKRLRDALRREQELNKTKNKINKETVKKIEALFIELNNKVNPY